LPADLPAILGSPGLARAGPRFALASTRRRHAMKRSLICLAMLATPLAACIVRPPEDCASCSDPSCPTSTSHSPPPSTYSSPPSPPPSSQSIPDALPPLWSERCGSDASPAVPPCNRDAGADLPSPSREVDAGAAVARPDSGVASPSDGGNLADLVAPSSCTDAGTCGKPVVPLCTWNHECGNGGRCADAECQRPCTSNSVCGTGDTCQADLCQPSGGAGGSASTLRIAPPDRCASTGSVTQAARSTATVPIAPMLAPPTCASLMVGPPRNAVPTATARLIGNA